MYITLAKAVFDPVSVLAMIGYVSSSSATRHPEFIRSQDATVNKLDYVELWLACVDVCASLNHGMRGRRLGVSPGPTLGTRGHLPGRQMVGLC